LATQHPDLPKAMKSGEEQAKWEIVRAVQRRGWEAVELVGASTHLRRRFFRCVNGCSERASSNARSHSLGCFSAPMAANLAV
jgi:hypothetical protein